MIPIFFLVPTYRTKKYLRRYSKNSTLDSNHSYHDAKVCIGEGTSKSTSGDLHSHNDPRYPTHCSCGYVYKEEDNWQVFHRSIYKRYDTGEEMTVEEAPVGSAYNASWMTREPCDPLDERYLIIKTPGGEWHTFAKATNCTMPSEKHFCWIKHGSALDGTLHIDKNGYTCNAGAGSIIIGDYHGFCHQGHLTPSI
jgi:hypothetical protein